MHDQAINFSHNNFRLYTHEHLIKLQTVDK